MKISDNGINLLKKLEGCVKDGSKHIIYDDQTGAPIHNAKTMPNGATIGYGHLIKKGEDFTNGIDEIFATKLLRQDLESAEHAVKNIILAPLNQNQFDALVIFVFNIGAANFAKSSVAQYINNPNFQSSTYPTLESAWKAWDKSNGRKTPGLVNRRTQEWILFNKQ